MVRPASINVAGVMVILVIVINLIVNQSSKFVVSTFMRL